MFNNPPINSITRALCFGKEKTASGGYCIIAVKEKQINLKKILAVINATYAVAKRKPEKIRLAEIRTLTSATPVPVGLLAQLVRALHRRRRGQGSNPGKPDFFRLSFRNCISCVNNCEDLL